jgi:hypothetical protein
MEFGSDVEMRKVSREAQEFFEKVLYDEEPLFVSDEATLWGVWMGDVDEVLERDLRLAGDSDWRLASLEELKGIYDKDANAPGLMGPSGKGTAATWHVKGNPFLTGNQLSSNQKNDDRGHPSGWAWRFDFNEGRSFDGDEVTFYTNKRALCGRGPQK